jgi:hypothetical protein
MRKIIAVLEYEAVDDNAVGHKRIKANTFDPATPLSKVMKWANDVSHPTFKDKIEGILKIMYATSDEQDGEA